MPLLTQDDYEKCKKAFRADDADDDGDHSDQSCFFIRSKVKPDTDYFLTGVWKNDFSVFSEDINTILKRLGAIISLDDEIANAVTERYKALINFENKRGCYCFYCCDDVKYCYINLRVDSSNFGFGFHLFVYCVDKELANEDVARGV